MIFKTNNCPFCNKTTQDFAEFGEICGNLKAKTKTEDEGVLIKGKWSSSWFLLFHITQAGWRDTPNFCYVKHPTVRCWVVCPRLKMWKYAFMMLSLWLSLCVSEHGVVCSCPPIHNYAVTSLRVTWDLNFWVLRSWFLNLLSDFRFFGLIFNS